MRVRESALEFMASCMEGVDNQMIYSSAYQN